MRILHLARTMGQGGAEKVVYQLTCGNKEAGHHVIVVSSGGIYVNELEKKGICHRQIPDLECKNPKVMCEILAVLIKTVRKEKIDVIHTHHRMAALYARILKFFFKDIELVYTAHNVFYNKKKLTAFALAKTKIVAVGNSVRENLEHFFGIAPEKIQVIYNAVQTEHTDEEYSHPVIEEMISENFCVIGTVGRLSEQKGIDVFIQAMDLVKRKIPNIKGVIIGDGELREQLQEQILQNGLQDDIVMLGYQKHVMELIKQLELVVMPSRWEGFPLTPIEVFSMEKTVVASDIGGINEIVVHEENGLLVSMDDVSAFGEAIVRLLKQPELKERLERNARECYERQFRYENFAEQYEVLYQSCRK